MSKKNHSIVVIDDHPIIHAGIKTLFQNEPDLEITGSASSATEALSILEEQKPDLAIVDLSLSDAEGMFMIQKIKSAYPDLKLLVYTMSDERLFAERAALIGAHAFVMKGSGPDELLSTIRKVLQNEFVFSEGIQGRLRNRDKSKNGLLDNLSNREMDIFKLLGHGMDSLDISNKLNISRNTVDTHRINIKNKLNLQNGKALERLAYEIINQRSRDPQA